MKTCTKCKETKDLSAFRDHKAYRDGKVSWCISCQHLKTKEWNILNKSKKQAYDSQWKMASKYGINNEVYSKMLSNQNGLCKICNCTPDKAPKGKLYVDHCHETGKVRGLLCDHCNNVLGRAKDSIETLTNAIKYLRET